MAVEVVVNRLAAYVDSDNFLQMVSIAGVARGSGLVRGTLGDVFGSVPFEAEVLRDAGAPVGIWSDTVNLRDGDKPCACGRVLFYVRCHGVDAGGEWSPASMAISGVVGCGAGRCREVALSRDAGNREYGDDWAVTEVSTFFATSSIPGQGGSFVLQTTAQDLARRSARADRPEIMPGASRAPRAGPSTLGRLMAR